MGVGERAGALVLFGITGDLARKSLLPALYELFRTGRMDVPVVGVVRGRWTLDGLRERAREAIGTYTRLDEEVFARFCDRLRAAVVDYEDPSSFASIAEQTRGLGFLTHYLAVPPGLFTTVARNLAAAGLNEEARLVVEKPFGEDLASARALRDELTRCFPTERMLLVDHFLGKDVVENLVMLRFGNTLMRATLRSPYVRSVQLTLAEDFGVADRGSFYDGTGALRDVVQNHLLQTLAFLIMEEPTADDAAATLEAKAAALQSVRAVRPEDYVRGQYAGYLDVEGVAPGSGTETYAALRLLVDNDRWDGVPFAIRSGKCLAASVLEVVVELEPARGAAPNLVRFRLDPDPAVTFGLTGGETGQVSAEAGFTGLAGDDVSAYMNILADAVAGDPRRFAGMDIVEECWRIVGDILTAPGEPAIYRPGTWGPAEADRLTAGGHWFPPSAG